MAETSPFTPEVLESVCHDRLCIPDGAVEDLASISDGWECDVWAFRFAPPEGASVPLILRMYRGRNAAEKTAHETRVITALYEAGFPVPKIVSSGGADSTLNQPFMLMERVEGELLGGRMRTADEKERPALFRRFCALAAQLYRLPALPEVDTWLPAVSLDGWLSEAETAIADFGLPEFDPIIDWLRHRRSGMSDRPPSLIHGDFHPWNVILDPAAELRVIDWGGAQRTDFRFDLAWSLLLATGSFGDETRVQALRLFEEAWASPVEDLDFFEVAAAARRLADIAVSIRSGPESMGMRPEAVAMMRRSRAHETPSRILAEHTGIRVSLPELDEMAPA